VAKLDIDYDNNSTESWKNKVSEDLQTGNNAVDMAKTGAKNMGMGLLNLLEIFEIPFSETADYFTYKRPQQRRERMEKISQQKESGEFGLMDLIGSSLGGTLEETKGLFYDLPKEIVTGILNPSEATNWFDYGYKTPDEVIDNYLLNPLFGEELQSDLSEQQLNDMRNDVRALIGTVGSLFGDVDSVLGGLNILGKTDEGLTALKTGALGSVIDNANNVDEVAAILKKADVTLDSTMGRKIIDMKSQGKSVKQINSIEEAIKQGQKALLTKGDNTPIRPFGEAQKGIEQSIGAGLDSTKNFVGESAPGKWLRQLSSSTDVDLDNNLSDTLKINKRKGNRLVEVARQSFDDIDSQLDEIAKSTDFNKNELFDLAEYKNPISDFNGKEVPAGLQQQVSKALQPIEDIGKKLDADPNIAFNLSDPKLFESDMNYIPRQVTQEAREAMESANPDLARRMFSKSGDRWLFNKNFQDRIFKNIKRSKVNELTNKGDFGLVLSPDGNATRVGSFGELSKQFPEKANRNLVVNLTDGNKMDFYKNYSDGALEEYLTNTANTLAKENTFEDIMKVGAADEAIKPVSDSKNVEQGYVTLTREDVGDLAPMFEDVQVKNDLAKELMGINKEYNNIHLPFLGGDVSDNFKKLAIGTSPSYQGKNFLGNMIRSYTDPDKSVNDFLQGQMYGYANSVSDTKLGNKLNLEDLLRLNDDIKLPTGETTTAKKLYSEAIDQGNISSGFRGNVISDKGDSLKDALNRFYARAYSGENPIKGIWDTAKDINNSAVDSASGVGLKAREILTENPTRTGDYIGNRLAGFLPDTAQNQQFKNMIDYGDFGDSSKAVQTIFPFMKYQVKSKPLLISRLLENPGKFKYGSKASNYIENELEQQEEDYSVEDNPPPSYMKSPILVGKDDRGQNQYLDLNTIYGDVLGYTPSPSDYNEEKSLKDSVLDTGEQTAREIAGSTNPVIGAGYNIATGSDTLGRDLGETQQVLDMFVDSRLATVLKTAYPTINYLNDIVSNDSLKKGAERYIYKNTDEFIDLPDIKGKDTKSVLNEVFNPIKVRSSYEKPYEMQEYQSTKDDINEIKYDILNLYEGNLIEKNDKKEEKEKNNGKKLNIEY